MKGSCTLVASVVAASTVAVALTSSSSSSGDHDIAFNPCSGEGFPSTSARNEGPSSRTSTDKEKFAPRFDGLRFIETLVTAHR